MVALPTGLLMVGAISVITEKNVHGMAETVAHQLAQRMLNTHVVITHGIVRSPRHAKTPVIVNPHQNRTTRIRKSNGVNSSLNFATISTTVNSFRKYVTTTAVLGVLNQSVSTTGSRMDGATPKIIPRYAAGMAETAAHPPAKIQSLFVATTGGIAKTRPPAKTPGNATPLKMVKAIPTITLIQDASTAGSLMAGVTQKTITKNVAGMAEIAVHQHAKILITSVGIMDGTA